MLVVALCGSFAWDTPPPWAGAQAGAVTAPSDGYAHTHTDGQWTSGIDLTSLPVGTKVSTSPAVGSVYACQTTFNGGGAFTTGPWMKSDGTYDLTAKPVVDGEVTWTSKLEVTLQGMSRVFTGNGLPYHTTGTYPLASSDDAYQYDRNPNRIQEQTLSITVPATPSVASSATCLNGGTIGILDTGSVFFDALDAAGRDAVAYEIQDACAGHPERTGQYHYHSLSPCVVGNDDTSAHSPRVGYAIDGFGIYGPRGEGGAVLATSDLDECHGHTHEIEWDGQTVSLYHYHATWSYPYTLGCFRGTPARTLPAGAGPGGQGGPGGQAGQPGPGQAGPGQPGPGLPPRPPRTQGLPGVPGAQSPGA